MKTDLIQNFKKATAEIKRKEKPALKVCSFCGKASDDWIENILYEKGELVEEKTFVRCEKCRQKQLKRSKRK